MTLCSVHISIHLLLLFLSINGLKEYDPRNITSGITMYEFGYLDQPYCITINDIVPYNGTQMNIVHDRWVCVITGGPGHEGSSGERVLSLFSDNDGKTWSNPIEIETNTTLTNSYATIAINKYGRIYVMYNFNKNNISSLPNGETISRTDSLGYFAYKYSDNSGLSWSMNRYYIPYRNTYIDNHNTWNGTVDIMWSVDQTKWDKNNILYYGFTKIQNYPYTPPEEIWIISSDNIWNEMNINAINWSMSPLGNTGITPPNGNNNNCEEGHIIPLSDNKGFQIVFRTNESYLGCSYTNSNNINVNSNQWINSTYCQYSNMFSNTYKSIKYIKNPRGPITPQKVIKNTYNNNTMYLLLYYNNGANNFNDRNPIWIVSGMEYYNMKLNITQILWSQPEIILFVRDRTERPGYCDFVQYINNQTNMIEIYFTETNKTIARLHHIPNNILYKLLNQFSLKSNPSNNASLTFNGNQSDIKMSDLIPTFDYNTGYIPDIGFSLFLEIENHNNSSNGDVILKYMNNSVGMQLIVVDNYQIELQLFDINGNNFTIITDDDCAKSLLYNNNKHAFGFVVDGNVRIITLLVDGYLCDGSNESIFGWSWLPTTLTSLYNNQNELIIAPNYSGKIVNGYWFNKQLLTSDFVSFYRWVLSS